MLHLELSRVEALKQSAEKEEEVVRLEDLLRKDLDAMAEKLGMVPGDYKNKAEISAAIRETADAQGIDLGTLLE